MIGRVWRGWTTPEQADAYEHLLRDEIFPAILAKQIPGFRRIELFRRPAEAMDAITEAQGAPISD
jgi:hypothetical protein